MRPDPFLATFSVETEGGDFRVINPVGVLPRPSSGPAPCAIDRFYAPLFRIQESSPPELFCIAGIGVPGDQFKYVYDKYGFDGLVIMEIWRDVH